MNKLIAGVVLLLVATSAMAGDGEKGDLAVNIVSGLRGKCLDVAGAGYYNNTNIQTFRCHRGLNQTVFLKPVYDPYGDVSYQLIDKNSGLCYDVKGNSYYDRANIQLFKCHGGNNQLFKFRPLYYPHPNSKIQGANVQIVSVSSGKCLDVESESITYHRANIQQYRCKNIPNQLFRLDEAY